MWGDSLLWIGDDAFISFRYAENLASGRGLVFNEGERVEDYTNFFWTVLLASGRWLHVSPLLSSVVLSMGSWVVVLALMQRLVARHVAERSPLTISFAVLAGAWSYSMASFSTSGLETMFGAALVHQGVLALAERGRLFYSELLGVLGAMTHPDMACFT